MTLEEQLVGSLALIAAKKATLEASNLHIMANPAPGGSEIPELLSPSSVNCFLECQAKWFYSRVLRLPEIRGSALGLGTAVHTAVISSLVQKIETREDLPTEGTQAVFVGALTEEMDYMKLQPEENWDDLKAQGEALVRVFQDRIAPSIDPQACELHVEGIISDVPVHGYIDVLDSSGRVIDIKTSRRKLSGITPAHLLQSSTYAMLEPKASGDVQIVTLTKGRTADVHTASLTLKPAHKRLTERLYSITRDQMDAGLYVPSRGSFLCSKRHCGFHARCLEDFGGEVSE